MSFKVFLIFLMVDMLFSSSPCPKSQETLMRVDHCPRNITEWKNRSQHKRCDVVKQNCTEKINFQYHCLINEFIDKTVEVCAPVRNILGSKCAEYNEIGKIIQDSVSLRCAKCPFKYNSNEAYKYQECYAAIRLNNTERIKSKFNESSTCISKLSGDESSDRSYLPWIFLVLFILSFIINVVFTIFMIRQLLKKTSDVREGETDSCVSHVESTQDNSNNHESSPLINLTCLSPGHQGVSTHAETSSKICVAAIQLGDRNCGVAFSKGEDPAKVMINTFGKSPKPYTTTRMLLRDGKVVLFGYDALNRYIELLVEGQLDNHTYFDELIMSEKMNGDLIVKDSKGRESDAKHIYEKFLNRILKSAKDDNMGYKVHFIVTIPNRWSEKKEALVKQIIEKETRHKIVILRACFAVSPFLHEVKEEVLCHNFNVDNLSFAKDTIYSVLNVGTNTCEISYMKVLCEEEDHKLFNNHSFYEHEEPKTIFSCILKEIFKEETFNYLQENHPGDYFSMLRCFEIWHHDVDKGKGETKLQIPIPSIVFELVKKNTSTELKTHVERSQYETKLELFETYLEADYDLMMSCFSGVAKKASNLAKDEDKIKEIYKHVKCICITGAYSKFKIVEDHLKDSFPEKTILFPSTPELVVAKGAAFYGYKRLITSKSNTKAGDECLRS